MEFKVTWRIKAISKQCIFYVNTYKLCMAKDCQYSLSNFSMRNDRSRIFISTKVYKNIRKEYVKHK